MDIYNNCRTQCHRSPVHLFYHNYHRLNSRPIYLLSSLGPCTRELVIANEYKRKRNIEQHEIRLSAINDEVMDHRSSQVKVPHSQMELTTSRLGMLYTDTIT